VLKNFYAAENVSKMVVGILDMITIPFIGPKILKEIHEVPLEIIYLLLDTEINL